MYWRYVGTNFHANIYQEKVPGTFLDPVAIEMMGQILIVGAEQLVAKNPISSQQLVRSEICHFYSCAVSPHFCNRYTDS